MKVALSLYHVKVSDDGRTIERVMVDFTGVPSEAAYVGQGVVRHIRGLSPDPVGAELHIPAVSGICLACGKAVYGMVDGGVCIPCLDRVKAGELKEVTCQYSIDGIKRHYIETVKGRKIRRRGEK